MKGRYAMDKKLKSLKIDFSQLMDLRIDYAFKLLFSKGDPRMLISLLNAIFANKNIRPGTKCPFDCPYYKGEVNYDKSQFPQTEEVVNSSARIQVNEFYTDKDVEEIIAAINKVGTGLAVN